jgi:hypothetical protein
MTWQTCLRFVTRGRPLVLATTPDRAETSGEGGPMHDRPPSEFCNYCSASSGPGLAPPSTVSYRARVLYMSPTRCRIVNRPIFAASWALHGRLSAMAALLYTWSIYR